MKFLVFGFSVTAETSGKNGYVERCAARCTTERPAFDVTRVGIGGLQPNHARHLIEGILDETKPDALILEIATAVYRQRPKTDEQIADHTATLEAAFEACRMRNMRCGILDLPLTGTSETEDWMVETDQAVARAYNVPVHVVPLDESLLRDNVHPNDDGKDHYAQALLELLDQVAASEQDFSGLAPSRRFGAFAIRDIKTSAARFRPFSRADFSEQALEIPGGETVTVGLPKKVCASGLIMLMGPKTGKLQVRTGQKGSSVNCYDRHCYYERAGGWPLNPEVTDTLHITQTADVPDVELLKGEKDLGPRCGGVTHILFEETN